MRRFLTLVSLLFLAIPAGISFTGCSRNPGANYCNGLGYGMKIDDVASITLSPATTGLSLAYGQTKQISTPSAYTCQGSSATVAKYTYGTTNNQLVDISSSGNICAGTWNRNTGGGIADYTICTAPASLPSTNGLPYSSAYVTASASSVVSNPVQVFVHPSITDATLVGPSSCLSQNETAQLDIQTCYSGTKADGTTGNVLLCAPSGYAGTTKATCPLPKGVTASEIPACSSATGTFSFTLGTSTVGTINTNTNVITANLPGTTAISATVSNSTSSAGYFSTCPPKSISVAFTDGTTAKTISKGVTESLVTTVTDTNGKTITGLSLDYQSTDPMDIAVTSAGSITTNYAGTASVYAVCQPGTCNPAPASKVGLYGTGLAISSNPATITTTGQSSNYVWLSAPGASQYFVPVSLLTGTVGSSVRLPYVPNSMVMDRNGNSLYFGSSHELMVYGTSSNSLTKVNTNYPGVVLAVSPSNAQVLINDQVRHLFYLYNVSSDTATSFSGMGNAAYWSPDSKTIYITDNANLNTPSSCSSQTITGHTDTLYVYNVNTGMTTYSLPSSPLPADAVPSCSTEANMALAPPYQTPAITIPSVGAYLRGLPTEAHGWCPAGNVGSYDSMVFYPLADTVKDSSGAGVQSDVLAATTDGDHILGVSTVSNQIALADIGVTASSDNCLPADMTVNPLDSGDVLSPLSFTHTVATTTLPVSTSVSTVNQVIPSPVSKLAFVTYTPTTTTSTTTAATLPYYIPGTNGAIGTTSSVSLTAVSGKETITAPVAGAFTPDSKIFFVSTSGDNMIHYIDTDSTSSTYLKDTEQITPALPACTSTSSGGTDAGCTYSGSESTVPATAIAVKPRATT